MEFDDINLTKILVACKVFDYTYVNRETYTQTQVSFWTKDVFVNLLQNKTPRIITDWATEVCEVLEYCGLNVDYNICANDPDYCEIYLI